MPDIPNKRKRTVNPKLLDSDNMSIDAIKRCKVEAMKTVTQPPTQPSTSRRVSVEVVEDDDDISCRNAGTPTNPNTILESANDDDDNDSIYVIPGQAAERASSQVAERAKTKEAEETEEKPEETDEDELGMAVFDHHRRKTYSTHF